MPLTSCDKHQVDGLVWRVLCHIYKKEIDVGCTRAEIKDVLRFGMRDVYWNWDEACMKELG